VTIAAPIVRGLVIAGPSIGLAEILQVADMIEIVHLIADGLLELLDLVPAGATRVEIEVVVVFKMNFFG
jgi:hypothetical protein